MSAEILAGIEQAHQSAARVHQEASDRASAIEQRLEVIQSRMSEISAARVAGTATREQNDELVLLTHDGRALEKMHADVRAEVKSAGDLLHAAAVDYSDALRAHKREQAQAELLALREKASQIEMVLLRAIAEVHRVGKSLGHPTLSSSWQLSRELHRAVAMNVAPEVL